MLAFGSEKRMAKFPDVPTIAETVPGYEASASGTRAARRLCRISTQELGQMGRGHQGG